VEAVTSEAASKSPAGAGSKGKLYLVGTPIGNLDDITLRAIRTLKEVDLIACEDTRRTQQLLSHYGIRTPTTSYHDHNELVRAPELIIEIERGRDVALVSDAGMPVISDPGYRLVRLAIHHNIQVVPIPGASALVAALVAAGLPLESFHFLGFLPRKRIARRRVLERLRDESHTLVFYEAPHRLIQMLSDVLKLLGDREVTVAREVTKIHEQFVRGSLSEVIQRLQQRPVRGEITVIVGRMEPARQSGSAAGPGENQSIGTEVARIMKERDLDERSALKVVARERGISRSEAYRQWQNERNAIR
jgi:16S rRNA (cytidine1402-2'-O)-methyltransferase